MTWQPLSETLHTRPRVLAGPMLRQVTPTSVTVWLAMRVGATVVLTVKDETDVAVMKGERRSIAIGQNLHIVAVQASMLPPFSNLSDGVVYRYDLAFNFDGNLSSNLATATGNAVLAYDPWTLPSFSLPPADLNFLRLIQGSCRKPSAEGPDMLPYLSQLIAESAGNAYARPHQLLLTGDQIYADDVAHILSLLLNDAGEALLGWSEQYSSTLPLPNTPRAVKDLHPMLRTHFLEESGFTTDDSPTHLIGLGEYISMYLFVWSDVLWPATLPTFEEIRDEFKSRISAADEEVIGGMVSLRESQRDGIRGQTESLEKFRSTLGDVRRALANVPSYMVFDDHEITDDWNMTREFCNAVYGSEIGLRIIQNGLVAYTLCQHWGNVPEDFLDPSVAPILSTQNGTPLLAKLDTPHPTAADAVKNKSTEYDSNSADIRRILGIHDTLTLRARTDNAVFHDPDSIRFNFTVEGPSHQVIFTDTRTWRSFPGASDGTHLLTRNAQTNQFKEQILDALNTGDRLLFVVITTNAPPVQPIRAFTRHDTLSNMKEHFPDVYEAWDLPSTAFDRLLVALTSKLPIDASGQHLGSVVLLSGDVHHSFATRMTYRATKRFEDDNQPRGATAVIAQLVASSLKKQTGDTVNFHRGGYYATRGQIITNRIIRHNMTEGYVGWNFPVGPKQKVGLTGDDPGSPIMINRGAVDVSPGERLGGVHDSRAVDLTVAPHYRYRFDYLLPTGQVVDFHPPTITPIPAGSSAQERKDAARKFSAASQAYRYYNMINPPSVVGVNNIGEIRLDWGNASTQKVHHIVRWLEPNASDLRLTTYSVRLDVNGPNDSEFPDIKSRNGM